MLFIATHLLTFKAWLLLCCSVDSILLSSLPNVTVHLSFLADPLKLQCHLIMSDTSFSVALLRLAAVFALLFLPLLYFGLLREFLFHFRYLHCGYTAKIHTWIHPSPPQHPSLCLLPTLNLMWA